MTTIAIRKPIFDRFYAIPTTPAKPAISSMMKNVEPQPERKCPHCHKIFQAAGFKKHKKRCYERKNEEAAKLARNQRRSRKSTISKQSIPLLKTEHRPMVCCITCQLEVYADRLTKHYESMHSVKVNPSNQRVRKKLSFEIMPKAKSAIWERFEAFHQANMRRWNPALFDQERLEKLDELGPSDTYVGSDSWNGYVIFEFDVCAHVVLESPRTGNATYILPSTWRPLVELSKQELLQVHHDSCSRIIHSSKWLLSVKKAISSGHRKAAAKPYSPDALPSLPGFF